MNARARITSFCILFALLLGISALSHWNQLPRSKSAIDVQAAAPANLGRMPAPDAKAADGNVQDLSH